MKFARIVVSLLLVCSMFIFSAAWGEEDTPKDQEILSEKEKPIEAKSVKLDEIVVTATKYETSTKD
ncbi:MAG: hypothetical protein JJV98_10675, partial [Desulfosarcina sp.]|nr:hypothetical protein [Desulfobacterales bacterium]